YRTGKNDAEDIGGLIDHHPIMGWTFFIAGLSLAGVPPFPGFFGKLYIVESAFQNDHVIAAIIVLLSSLVVLYSVVRIFIKVFLGEARTNYILHYITYYNLAFVVIRSVIEYIIYGL